jgi:hypothetical protein
LGETLLLYVVATSQVVNTTLVVEREEPGHVYKVRRPVYYISKMLSDCETHYNNVKKLLYVILFMKRKLLHYFESHPICVVTLYELGEIIANRLTTVSIAKWDLKLMGFDITYVPQMVIKSQALAVFMAEWTETQQSPLSPRSTGACISMAPSLSMGPGGSIVWISAKGDRLLYVIRMHFLVTNNVVEYEALVNGLCITIELGVQ